jgi:hypothetical protein
VHRPDWIFWEIDAVVEGNGQAADQGQEGATSGEQKEETEINTRLWTHKAQTLQSTHRYLLRVKTTLYVKLPGKDWRGY